MENISLVEVKDLFNVPRSENIFMYYRLFESWSILFDSVKNNVFVSLFYNRVTPHIFSWRNLQGERVFTVLLGDSMSFIRGILDEQLNYMVSWLRQGVVSGAWNSHLDGWGIGSQPIIGLLESKINHLE